MTATVIIPTTGADQVRDAIDSVLAQTYPTKCFLVCDGNNFRGKVMTIASERLGNPNFEVCYLPENVGANGFYGHRVYAAFTHLINTEHVLYLDQDCWFDTNHVKTCVETIQQNKSDWCYSLRKIYNKDSEFICRDDCEALGKWQAWTNTHHIDTNSYCLTTKIAIRLASAWHGGWGQDRVFLSALLQHFPKFECTGQYTSNYRVDGNAGSVTGDFFLQGNEVMKKQYNGKFPWIKS